MIIIPAIDLKDGQCVRLRQGRMDEATVFSADPVQMAAHWVEQGATRLHLVDLNGAFDGRPVNGDIVRRIVANHPDCPVQIGGGIRDMDTVAGYLQTGVEYVIIGTQAVRDPDFVREACRTYPGHVIVGIDARDGRVATEGWAEDSGVDAVELASRFADAGVSAVVYTDIARDGMLSGVNVESTAQLAARADVPVIASGGIRDLDDLVRLEQAEEPRIVGAITGRAIYEGTLDFRAALDWQAGH